MKLPGCIWQAQRSLPASSLLNTCGLSPIMSFFFPDQACMILHGNVDIDKNCVGLNPCTFSTKILQSPIGEEACHTENICWPLCQAWGLLSMLIPPLEWGTGIILDYMDEEKRTERAFKKCAPRHHSSGSAGPGIKPTLWTSAQWEFSLDQSIQWSHLSHFLSHRLRAVICFSPTSTTKKELKGFLVPYGGLSTHIIFMSSKTPIENIVLMYERK